MHQAVRRALERFARNSELLSLLDAEAIQRLSHCGQIEHRDAAEIIVRQGDSESHNFYLLVAGSVGVRVDDGLDTREVATLEAGNFFGEIGALTQQPRSATVISETPVELIAFERESVLAVLFDYPAAREAVGRVGLARSEQNLTGQGLAESLEGPEERED
ncbi:MAG: cyclic nucleotide-binding domain-containing protein [Myxococcota bacterium]